MARETHPPSGPPGRLPGLGQKRAFALRGEPTRGAADVAPTAPHATEPDAPRTNGTTRFWDRRRVRVALVVSLIFSGALHGIFSPWNLLPSRSGVEFHDPDGELSIPVDLLGEEAPPPPPPPPAPTAQDPPPTSPEKDPNGLRGRDASAPRPKDAGVVRDADVADADAELDGGVAFLSDGSVPQDGGDMVAFADGGGAVALADAGAPSPGAAGPRDPGEMIGLKGIVSAGQVNVTLLLNIAAIRKNPVGAKIGPLLYAIPQWNDFLKGSQTTVDPIQNIDWILIYGPSLIHTERDAVFVRYNVADAIVDRAVDNIAKSYDKGGPFDAGVPGVRASLGHADNAARVFLRPQPKLLVIVPPEKAKDFATVYKVQSPRGPIATEALRLTVKDPWKQVAVPGLKFPQSLKEIRLWIVPRADNGADVFAEGDCTDAAAASDTADALTDLIRRQNSFVVRALTRNLLDGAKVVPEGTKITLHLDASQAQLEAILQLIQSQLPPPRAPTP